MLAGSHVENWAEAYGALAQAQGAVRVGDADELTQAWAEALDDRESALCRAERARVVAEGGAHALDAAVEQLKSLLP